MNKRKLVKSITWAIGVAAMVAPLAAVVSCGSSNNKSVSNPFGDLTVTKGFAAGGAKSSYGDDVQDAATAVDATKAPDKWWGYEAQSYWIDARVENERDTRDSTGQPFGTFRMSMDDLWNFDPGRIGHDGDAKVLEAQAGTTLEGDVPDTKDYWGETADQKYNKASVRDIAPRVFGEKLKDSQSAFATYYQMNPLTREWTGKLGMLPGKENKSNSLSGNWVYSEIEAAWGGGIKYPSGPEIDAAHRNGVPIEGTCYFSQRAWENPDFLRLMDPGVNNDYPGAKGMVEVADYYGFDGYMFNWEGEPSQATATKTIKVGGTTYNKGDSISITEMIEPFLKKLREYMDAPSNKNGTLTANQKQYHYYHRPQTLTIYTGGTSSIIGTGSQPKTLKSVNYSDWFTFCQGHGATPTPWVSNRLNSRIPSMTNQGPHPFDSDIFHANLGENFDEDGLTDTLKSQGAGLKYGRHPEASAAPAVDGDGRAFKTRANENLTSLWMYSYNNLSIIPDEKLYNSFVGDPRFKDDFMTTSASDLFQERSTITGHKNWTTTFDWGSGLGFNLWGGTDLASSLVGSNDKGWSNWTMQSFAPTYKWIVDEFDANGNPIVDKDHLTLTSDKKSIVRKINPKTNNVSQDAWYGGTTIDYSGKLNKGESFTNKLFASAVPVKKGDKFTIKVKTTDLISNDQSEVNLAAWTTDKTVEVPKLNDDGFFEGKDVIRRGTTPFGQKLKAGAPVKDATATDTVQIYQKEEAWNYKRTQHIVKPAETKAIGNTGWTELTYDLTSLSGKTLVDFGVNAKAKDDGVDYANLRLGEMHFEAAGTEAVDKPVMKNFKTTKIWDMTKEKSARIEWDSIFQKADGTELDPTSDVATDRTRAIDDNANIKQYVVCYADDAWNLNAVGWVGANTVAYLKNIDKTADHQNIVIMAVDNDYNVISQTSVKIELGGK